MSNYKTCSSCKANLPFSEFHKHPRGQFGLHPRCKPCKALSDKNSKLNNPNRDSDNSKRFRLSNPEYMSNWRKDNPEKVLAANAKRRSRLKNNGVYFITEKDGLALYNSNCFYCGSDKQIQADHIIPIARGGSHSIGNLLPACATCNKSKKDSTIMEWRMRLIKANKTI